MRLAKYMTGNSMGTVYNYMFPNRAGGISHTSQFPPSLIPVIFMCIYHVYLTCVSCLAK